MSRDYSHTLRLPRTDFPMRTGAAGVGAQARLRKDLARLEHALGSSQAAEHGYRQLRNALRMTLGCLAHGAGVFPPEGPPALERHMLALLSGVRKAEASRLCAFAKDDFLAFWFDVRKDALYCEPDGSPLLLSSQAFLREAFHELADAAEPHAPNLVAEAREHLPAYAVTRAEEARRWPEPPGWEAVRLVMTLAMLEEARTHRELSSSLEAQVTLRVPTDMAAALESSGWEPALTLSVSRTEVIVEPDRKEPSAEWKPAEGRRCARSWRYTDDVGSDPRFPDLSSRDATAVAALQAAG